MNISFCLRFHKQVVDVIRVKAQMLLSALKVASNVGLCFFFFFALKVFTLRAEPMNREQLVLLKRVFSSLLSVLSLSFVSCCLEYGYHQLSVRKHFNTSPIISAQMFWRAGAKRQTKACTAFLLERAQSSTAFWWHPFLPPKRAVYCELTSQRAS